MTSAAPRTLAVDERDTEHHPEQNDHEAELDVHPGSIQAGKRPSPQETPLTGDAKSRECLLPRHLLGEHVLVDYTVHVDVEPPEGTPELDELQCHGAGALISEGFGNIDGVQGPDGIDVDVVDFRVATHPGGALLLVFVETSALEFAEFGVRHLAETVLHQTETLARWRILRCAVELGEHSLQASLEAADGPDAPPEDPAERAIQHARTPEVHIIAPTEREIFEHRAALIADASKLRAFSLQDFNYFADDPGLGVSREDALVAMGALISATVILIDELFADLHTLAKAEATVADDPGLMVLPDLPARYAVRYDARFTRRFLVAAVSVTGRLTNDAWEPPACIAEALALDLLIDQAKVVLDLHSLMDMGRAESIYEAFSDSAFEDADHELLYSSEFDGIDQEPGAAYLGIAPLDLASWFVPFDDNHRMHPFGQDPDPDETDRAPGAETWA